MAITREQLLTFLNKKTRAKLDAIGDDDALFSSGTINSLVMIELLGWLEKQLGRGFGAEHVSLDNFDTINAILAFSAKHQA